MGWFFPSLQETLWLGYLLVGEQYKSLIPIKSDTKCRLHRTKNIGTQSVKCMQWHIALYRWGHRWCVMWNHIMIISLYLPGDTWYHILDWLHVHNFHNSYSYGSNISIERTPCHLLGGPCWPPLPLITPNKLSSYMSYMSIPLGILHSLAPGGGEGRIVK